MSRASFRKIILPVEFTDESLEWAALAAENAYKREQILFVHVLPPDLMSVPGRVWNTSFNEERVMQAERELWRELSARGVVKPQITVTIGNPSRLIGHIARSQQADLIAVTSHTRMGWESGKSNSVAAELVESAPCAVFVAKIGARDRNERPQVVAHR